MTRIRRRRATAVAAHAAAATLLASLALLLPVALSAPAVAAGPAPAPAPSASTTAQLELPRPTGPYASGRQTLHLVDKSRRDPWVPSAGARELMVSMYYPASSGSGGSGGGPAPYMTMEESRLLLESQGYAGVFPPELLATTRTNARTEARPKAGRHPLVVLSPGFSLNRATLTLLAEELSSRGYVVALMDHAYESVGTAFPGGRTLTCAACDKITSVPVGEERKAALAGVAKGRAADASFVLDRLTGRHPVWKYAGMIDHKRIGMAGHSIGGNSAARAMESDSRIRAGVNMDGTFYAHIPADGLDGRPFMMLGTDSLHRPGGMDDSWNKAWQSLDGGWKRWLTVTGSGHFTFIDLPVLGGQVGLSDPEAPLPGKRSGEITRDYVGAFFDQHLRGVRQPLLEGPSAANPEVLFQQPE